MKDGIAADETVKTQERLRPDPSRAPAADAAAHQRAAAGVACARGAEVIAR